MLGAADNSTAVINLGGSAQATLPAFPVLRGAGATATLNFDGGTLIPAASNPDYLGGLTNAFLSANGGSIDVPTGRDITISQGFENAAAQSGTLTKSGVGVLTLTGINSYTGATNVNAGTLLISGSVAGATIVNSGAALGGDGSVGARIPVDL